MIIIQYLSNIEKLDKEISDTTWLDERKTGFYHYLLAIHILLSLWPIKWVKLCEENETGVTHRAYVEFCKENETVAHAVIKENTLGIYAKSILIYLVLKKGECKLSRSLSLSLWICIFHGFLFRLYNIFSSTLKNNDKGRRGKISQPLSHLG